MGFPNLIERSLIIFKSSLTLKFRSSDGFIVISKKYRGLEAPHTFEKNKD